MTVAAHHNWRRAATCLALLGGMVLTRPAWAATADDAALKTQLNLAIRTQVHVQPMTQLQDAGSGTVVSTTAIVADSSGAFVLTKRATVGLPTWGDTGTKKQIDIVSLTGKTEPHAQIELSLGDAGLPPIAAQADANGGWTIVLPVDSIPEGMHTAYVQTAVAGVQSDSLPVAKFVALPGSRFSNAAWMSLIVIGCTIIVLLLVVVCIVQRRRMGPQIIGSYS